MIETIKVEQKTGREPFLGMPHTLCDYWAWAHSDIASNAERGKLAEYLVRCAVQAYSPYRTEWDAFDVLSEEGIKIEVKASSYLQTWRQERFSSIQFDIAPKRWWDAETNTYAQDKSRPADVYVFCLFSCKDAGTANPLDLKQWEFYVLSTRVLDKQAPPSKTNWPERAAPSRGKKGDVCRASPRSEGLPNGTGPIQAAKTGKAVTGAIILLALRCAARWFCGGRRRPLYH